MFTNNYLRFILQWLTTTLVILLLLSACLSADTTATQPDPTAMSTPVATLEPTTTIAPTVTAVPTTYSSPQISLDTGGVAAGFHTKTVAAVSEGEGGPYWGVMPEYTLLTLPGYPISNHLMTPQIFIYPVEDLQAVNEGTVPIVNGCVSSQLG